MIEENDIASSVWGLNFMIDRPEDPESGDCYRNEYDQMCIYDGTEWIIDIQGTWYSEKILNSPLYKALND